MKWIKFIILCCIFFIISCRKVDIPVPIEPTNSNIFSVKESVVTDGQIITFDLKTDGIYTLTIGNSETNQVITRERFAGKAGQNKLTLYTKSLPSSYLYLLLEDGNKSEVSKTTIIIK